MTAEYKNIHTGEEVSPKEYRVRMMSYFEKKTTESERAELYDLYGARCMEFWLMTHPHPDYILHPETDPSAPSTPAEAHKPDSLVSVPTPTPIRRLPPAPPKNDGAPLVAPLAPPRRLPPQAPPGASAPVQRKSPPRQDPFVQNPPPKRVVEPPQSPPRRVMTPADSVPEPVSAVLKNPGSPTRPSFNDATPSGGTVSRTKTTPKVELRPVHVQAAGKEIPRPKTQAELRMLVKNNTYFMDTPTDDEGVYRRAIKRNPKEVMLIVGLVLVGVVLACVLAYVLFT